MCKILLHLIVIFLTFCVGVVVPASAPASAPSFNSHANAHNSHFEKCDADADRSLTVNEMAECLRLQGGLGLGQGQGQLPSAASLQTQQVHHFMAILDTNGDGRVQLEEYAVALKRVQSGPPPHTLDGRDGGGGGGGGEDDYSTYDDEEEEADEANHEADQLSGSGSGRSRFSAAGREEFTLAKKMRLAQAQARAQARAQRRKRKAAGAGAGAGAAAAIKNARNAPGKNRDASSSSSKTGAEEEEEAKRGSGSDWVDEDDWGFDTPAAHHTDKSGSSGSSTSGSGSGSSSQHKARSENVINQDGTSGSTSDSGSGSGSNLVQVTLRNGSVLSMTRDDMLRLVARNERANKRLLRSEEGQGQGTGTGTGRSTGTSQQRGNRNAKRRAYPHTDDDEDEDEDSSTDADSDTNKNTDGYTTVGTDQLSRSHPDLARYIGIVKWAVARLQSADSYEQSLEAFRERHHTPAPAPASVPASASASASASVRAVHVYSRLPAVGSLEQVRSLPAGGSPFRGGEKAAHTVMGGAHNDQGQGETEKEKETETETEELFMEFSLRLRSKKNKNGGGGGGVESFLRKFEMHLSRDPARYRYPHWAVVGLWELDDTGKRQNQKSFQLPKIRYTNPRLSGSGSGSTSADHTSRYGHLGNTTASASASASSFLHRISGHVRYLGDVCADLAAMFIDLAVDSLDGKAETSAEDQGQGQGQGQGRDLDVVFLVVTAGVALACAALYLVVLPLLWLAFSWVAGWSGA